MTAAEHNAHLAESYHDDDCVWCSAARRALIRATNTPESMPAPVSASAHVGSRAEYSLARLFGLDVLP